jgi:hypothetical protein
MSAVRGLRGDAAMQQSVSRSTKNHDMTLFISTADLPVR